jgi:hypothetical protein
MLDFLAEKALTAIKTDSNSSWVADKARRLDDTDRLGVLRWICSSLDSENKHKVCQALGIDDDDLDAVERVLKKI